LKSTWVDGVNVGEGTANVKGRKPVAGAKEIPKILMPPSSHAAVNFREV
jgi:hypothetical protein